MSLSMVRSRALIALDAPAVTVEVDLVAGLPAFTLVGLTDIEVREAREQTDALLPIRKQIRLLPIRAA